MRGIVIEFLSFKGCPHAPILRKRLDEALHAIGVTATPLAIDLHMLRQANDLRSGFGSPTILLGGLDLFNMATPSHAQDPACRLYRPSRPTTAELIEKLREGISDSQ